MLNGSILHLDHKKHDRTGGSINWMNSYDNDDTWGFNYFNIKQIEDNIFVINYVI
jgi:hypothetical protein